jgi:hypothetical protein
MHDPGLARSTHRAGARRGSDVESGLKFLRARYYDLGTDVATRRLSIECNVPLEIVATVEDLDVTLAML